MRTRVSARVAAVGSGASRMASALARELAASWHRRFNAALMVIVCIIWGLYSRDLVPGIVGNCLGIVWYAAMWYALIVAVGPRVARWKTAVSALSVCWAIELFQLTPWPSQWAQLGLLGLLSRAVLGVGFQFADLVSYPVGAAAALAAHWVAEWNRARKQGRRLAPLHDWAFCEGCGAGRPCDARGGE